MFYKFSKKRQRQLGFINTHIAFTIFIIAIVLAIAIPNIIAYKKRKEKIRIDNCNEAIRLNPNSADAYYNRGLVYYDQFMFDEARKDYSQAIILNPNNTAAYIERGNLNYNKYGDKKSACEDWRKACELGDCDKLNRAKKKGTCQ